MTRSTISDPTKAVLEALTRQLSEAARDELLALRSAFDQQMAASLTVLVEQRWRELIDTATHDLSRTAIEQANVAATRARQETQASAERALADARAAAQKQLDDAAATNALLRERLTAAEQQLVALQDKAASFEATCAVMTAQLEEALAAQAKLTDQLSETERQVQTARREADVLVTRREALERDLHVLDQQRSRLEQQLDAALARVEYETRQRQEVTERLEQAREMARRAMTETATCLQTTADHLEALKARQQRLDSDIQVLQHERTHSDMDGATLGRLRDGLRALESATTVEAVLGALVAQLGQAFARAAIFFQHRESLKGYISVGLDATHDVTTIAIPLSDDSLLTQAFNDGMLATLEAPLHVGPFGSPVEWAIAVPVIAYRHVMVVAYAEQVQLSGTDPTREGQTFAEILAVHAGRRLAAMTPPPQSVEPTIPSSIGPASSTTEDRDRCGPSSMASRPIHTHESGPAHGGTRQTQRFRMREGTELTVDGQVSRLIDLSLHGAQVVSPAALRPNQIVRLRLPLEKGTLACQGEIRWAMFELSRDGGPWYRAGVRFSHVDVAAVESFMATHAQIADVSAAYQRPDSSGVA